MPQKIEALVVIVVLALAVTFVLFRFLRSQAKGKSKTMGGTIKYGGALAGFVVVTGVMLLVYSAIGGGGSNVDISGKWDIRFVRTDGIVVEGEADVVQDSGATSFSVSGTVNTEKVPGFVSFSSTSGTITGRSVVFVYRNSRGEEGIAKGDLTDDAPTLFTVVYADSTDSDRNEDPKGTIEFRKQT